MPDRTTYEKLRTALLNSILRSFQAVPTTTERKFDLEHKGTYDLDLRTPVMDMLTVLAEEVPEWRETIEKIKARER